MATAKREPVAGVEVAADELSHQSEGADRNEEQAESNHDLLSPAGRRLLRDRCDLRTVVRGASTPDEPETAAADGDKDEWEGNNEDDPRNAGLENREIGVVRAHPAGGRSAR